MSSAPTSVDDLLKQILNQKSDKQKSVEQQNQQQPIQQQMYQQQQQQIQQKQQFQQQMPQQQMQPLYMYQQQMPQQQIPQQFIQQQQMPQFIPYQQFNPYQQMPQYVGYQQMPQYVPQVMQQQIQPSMNYFAPAVQQQQPQQVKHVSQQRKLTPEESEKIDVDKIYIDPEKQWQLHISQLPLEVTKKEIEDAFSCYGEIKDISTFSQKTYAFVNFKTKEAAMRAFQNVDQIFIRGEKIKLQSSHNELQIILRRIPTKIEGREAEFISCLKTFLEEKEKGLFCHIQVEKASSLYSAYLHFLTKSESKNAFSYLRTIEFTKYCNERMHLVNDYEHAVYITNEMVDERTKRGEQVNQDPERELCQFMCLRFVKETSSKGKQQQQQQQYQQMTQQVQQEQQPLIYATSVYLNGVPIHLTEQQIRKLMEQFGTVKEVKIISKRQSETNCNCAVVKFVQAKEATKAKDAMTVITEDGEPIKIQPHVKKN